MYNLFCFNFFLGLTSNWFFFFRFDTEHSQDDEVHVESFCVITAGIQVRNKTKQTNKQTNNILNAITQDDWITFPINLHL